jgi:L-asparaginase/beta-aspartyl-peptidase (threonine type)
MVVTHGGTESKPEEADGCEAAARAGVQALSRGGDSLDAVVAAVSSLEADGRYNAGRGSLLCMDGKTLSCDASVMDTRGRLGAVANLGEVLHPVQVARRVADTPHHLIVGPGALEFARRIGLHQPFEPTGKARQEYREQVQQLKQAPRQGSLQAEDADSKEGQGLIRQFWNYPVPWSEAVDRAGHSTVGAVARDAEGHFAAAVSTGGSMPALLGRVGDSPLIGCGFYAGPAGAVVCTGIGEHILRHLLALRAYERMASGLPLRRALQEAMALLPEGVQVALAGISAEEAELVSREPMASARLEQGD